MAQSGERGGGSPPGKTREVALEPYLPEGTPVVYSDGLSVSTGNGAWTLSFLQAEPPIDPREKPTAIPSRCIVRIVVTDDRIVEFIRAILGSADHKGILPQVLGEDFAAPIEVETLSVAEVPNAD